MWQYIGRLPLNVCETSLIKLLNCNTNIVYLRLLRSLFINVLIFLTVSLVQTCI